MFVISRQIIIEKSPISNFTEIPLLGTALLSANRQTDMMKGIGAFRDLKSVPSNLYQLRQHGKVTTLRNLRQCSLDKYFRLAP
jgi:hypothetical protein